MTRPGEQEAIEAGATAHEQKHNQTYGGIEDICWASHVMFSKAVIVAAYPVIEAAIRADIVAKIQTQWLGDGAGHHRAAEYAYNAAIRLAGGSDV